MSDDDDHDIHGAVVYVGTDGSQELDPCCGCDECDCEECAG